jgi:hypothetical protein
MPTTFPKMFIHPENPDNDEYTVTVAVVTVGAELIKFPI